MVTTMIVAVGGWVIAFFQLFWGYRERRRNADIDWLFRVVGYFDGGAQRRSIGIALVEGMLRKNKEYRSSLLPLFANQIVYLLLDESVEASPHEMRNLIRLLILLDEFSGVRDSIALNSLIEAREALTARLEGDKASPLQITTMTLNAWCEKYGRKIAPV
jgi:hypothetical protein